MSDDIISLELVEDMSEDISLEVIEDMSLDDISLEDMSSLDDELSSPQSFFSWPGASDAALSPLPLA